MLHLSKKTFISNRTQLQYSFRKRDICTVIILTMLLVALLSMVACSNASATLTTMPSIFFPKEQPSPPGVERAFMMSLLNGKLVETEGCLRVTNDIGANYLIIWPLEYTLSTAGNQVQILDGIGQAVASIGDEVSLGGGEIAPPSQEPFEQDHPDLPNSNCPGPYWLASPQEK